MLDTFRTRMAARGSYEGEARRRNSQKIMDASWMRDTATKPVYVKWVDSGLPVVDDDDEVLYAKYNVKSYHNITGDEVSYLLQFRMEDMKERSDIKVGSYVKIPNEIGEYEWWLIWHIDDRPQFRQCSILKCLHVYRWTSHKDGRRIVHESLGCPRNQSSYNSGVWLDYTMQVVENQHIMVIPTNDDSKTVEYDTKFLISEPGRYPPIAWKVSKIAPSLNGDITRFTMTQEQFDPARDNAELMIGNYYDGVSEQVVPSSEETHSDKNNLEITYSNLPAVKAGGGYKKFVLKERVADKLEDVTDVIDWNVDFGGNESKLVIDKQGSILKVQCTKDYSLIGSTFTITAITEHGSKSLVVEVTSL